MFFPGWRLRARSAETSRMICAVGHETLLRVVDKTMWGVLAANRAYAISLFEGIRSSNGTTRSGLA